MGYPGSNVVTGPISLSASTDVYATHWASLGRGGHASVNTILDRDTITVERREFGMTRRVTGDPTPANNKNYVLKNLAMGGVDDNLMNNANWTEESSTGTVTSVGVSMPSPIFDVTSSPVTSSGVIAVTLKTQNANYILAGPVSGAAGTPGFRPMVIADVPNLSSLYVSTGGGTMTGNLTLSSNPTDSLHAVTKSYVDAMVTGLSWKSPAADAATTANITLSGEQTVDGFVTSASRILVKNQTVKSFNGIYRTGSGAWTREPDADDSSEMKSATIMVLNGTVNVNSQWTCISKDIDLGTSDIEFTKISSSASYSAGAGLSLSSGVFSIATGGVSDSMLRNSTALSVIGRSANSAGAPADISGASGVLRISSSVLGFGTIATADIANSQVTYAKIQNISATARLLGRYSTGAGVAQEISLGSGLSLDSGTGVLTASGGGGGTITGTGTAGRVSIWTGATALGDDSTLTYDVTNDILKAGRVNVSVAADPSAGVTDGDFVYNSTAVDFRARINGYWVNLTRQESITDGATLFTLNESHRGKIVYLTSSSPISVLATNLSTGFTTTVVKAGVGNVTINMDTGMSFVGADSVISTSWGYATLYKRTATEWAGVGALGTTGGSFVLTNGSGTTASGNAVNLGGGMTGNVAITPDANNTRIFSIGGPAVNKLSVFEVAAGASNSNYNYISVNASNVGLASTVSSLTHSISLDSTGVTVTLSGTKAFKAAADYSANFVDLSYITRAFADGRMAGKTVAAPLAGNNGQSLRWNSGTNQWDYFSPSSTTNGSGTTVNGSAIDLGGPLTANATVNQLGFNLTLGVAGQVGGVIANSGTSWMSLTTSGGVSSAELRAADGNTVLVSGLEATGTKIGRVVSSAGAINRTLHLYRGTGSVTGSVGGGLSVVFSTISGDSMSGAGVLSYVNADVTGGAETGKFRFNTRVGASDTNAAEIAYNGSWFNTGVSIGTAATLPASTILQLTSTNQAILLTRVTADANIVTPVNGMLYYNTTSNTFRAYQGGAWVNFIPTSGNGITVSGTGVNLGGPITANVNLLPDTQYTRSVFFGNTLNYLNVFGVYAGGDATNRSLFVVNNTGVTASSGGGIYYTVNSAGGNSSAAGASANEANNAKVAHSFRAGAYDLNVGNLGKGVAISFDFPDAGLNVGVGFVKYTILAATPTHTTAFDFRGFKAGVASDFARFGGTTSYITNTDGLAIGGTTLTNTFCSLDLVSTSKAMVVNRISNVVSTITTPVNGMIAYETVGYQTFKAYVNGAWVNFADPAEIYSLSSTSTTTSTINLDFVFTKERDFYGSQTFSGTKDLVFSNTTYAQRFSFHFEVTALTTLQIGSGIVESDARWTGSPTYSYTISTPGKYTLTGQRYNGTLAAFKFKLSGVFA